MAHWLAGSHSAPAGNNTSANVDTIDLTLSSSPEPELRPRTTATPQRQQIPVHVKAEPRPIPQSNSFTKASNQQQHTDHVKTEPTGRGHQHAGILKPQKQHAQSVKRAAPSQSGAIHPTHLAMIIDTSSPHALREVLLHLCHRSLALSGAVARGLAPHSTYARSLVRQHCQPSPASTNSTVDEDRDEGLGAYFRMNQKPAVHTPPQKPRSQLVSYTNHHVSTPHYKIKEEQSRHMNDLEVDLDMELNLPVPSSARHTKTMHRTTTPNASSSMTRQTLQASLQQSARSDNAANSLFQEMHCFHCHEPFEDEYDTCFWHPEAKTNDVGARICTECEAPMDDLGCRVGTHVRG